jgi:S-(hydroxymethyl)glutathione dehydrogenase/alcohol dehydrogenase
VRALVARAVGEPLRVEEVDLPAPGPGEVRVDIRAAGVCHSDLSMVDGTIAPPYPLVLGHEAAGVVTEVGDGVSRVAAGEPLHVTLGLGALAEAVVVPQEAVIPVPPELPFEAAALLGCAVLTGAGAVRRTARVAPGDSVAVIGLGGVGLSAVSAARAAGADPVLAVDVSPAKAALAVAAGATEFLLADDSVNRAVRGRTAGRGVDHALECVGRSATIRTAWRAARRGGQVIVVGMGAKDDVVGLSALDIFHSARTLRSSVYGSSDPDRDVPELARAVLDGALDLAPLITDRCDLDGAAAAFDRMARGEGARTVVLP